MSDFRGAGVDVTEVALPLARFTGDRGISGMGQSGSLRFLSGFAGILALPFPIRLPGGANPYSSATSFSSGGRKAAS